ncbi:MAG TPA: C45 family autoproteolytic acyltransferase/hydrolase [Candidatus Solibacter sp.]|nr:C45 family autoproteolytic acyltransferase/hydrolase [Candidatus Solibacter sp.]
MRAFVLCLTPFVAAFAATVYEAPLDQLTILRGSAVPDSSVHRTAANSLRVQPGKIGPDAAIRTAPVQLTIGKRYELSGWVRTDNLTVRDTGRSPIATGATLSMASMPFDVHSASLAGTRDWTRLSLKFTATRAQDQVVLSVGNGGSFEGKAWFEGVAIDEASTADEWPAREAVKTFGPAYRYPSAGWIYLHIEGEPYERGYQHGFLMAREIPEYMARCAADLGTNEAGWGTLRTQANALFLRGFDREILEEMRGIADGASDAGARWQERRIDLVDVVVANVTVELGELRSAMNVTATGLEGLKFTPPSYFDRKRDVPVTDRCSAFAATGPATRNGKMIVGHVTWWPLTLAEQTNVMLDVKPAKGHRVLMQSYPGGIESGTDWYQNDAGLVLTETTIRQTPFNAQGTPVAYRARLAIQYADNIDDMVRLLGTKNNGLYTNEWLMGDGKNNEIAMYELGTLHTKLWRSSRNEWFSGTPGFYWGNNNAKDLTIRTEYLPDPHGTQEYVPYVPAVRDLAWLDFYNKNKGRIDEEFAFTAFRTAPLVSGSTMDAKVATADMANKMMVWAAIGKPNQREWVARGGYEKNDGLFPSGYALFNATPSESLAAHVRDNEQERTAAKQTEAPRPGRPATRANFADRLWKGWIIPQGEEDTWFAAGSTAYLRVLVADDLEKEIESWRIQYRGLKHPLDDNAITRFRGAEVKGVLFLDSLRRKMGDDKFLDLMSAYFNENTTKTVTAASFLAKAGTTFDFTEPADGPAHMVTDIGSRLANAVIVYGTLKEAGANRYAAEQIQQQYLGRLEQIVPIYKDFEVNDEMLSHMDVVFVGRPEANQALAAWSKQIGLEWEGASFKLEGKMHASEREALTYAAMNPMDPGHMVLVIAGNDALRTVKTATAMSSERTAYVLSGSSDGAAAVRGGRRR